MLCDFTIGTVVPHCYYSSTELNSAGLEIVVTEIPIINSPSSRKREEKKKERKEKEAVSTLLSPLFPLFI